MATGSETPPYAVLAEFELARVLAGGRRPGDLDEAATLCARVSAVAERLGMAPLRPRADELAATLRGDRPGTLRAATAKSPGFRAGAHQSADRRAHAHSRSAPLKAMCCSTSSELALTNRTQVAAWGVQQH
ncbi:hypothetical protein [Nocardia xishanensis]